MDNIVALVIGGTGGIGSAIAKSFSVHDAKVYLTYFKNYEKSLEMKDISDKCEVLHCDITKEENVNDVLKNILQKESRIDVVVNCATGNLKLKPFDHLTMDEFYSDIQVILLGSVNIHKCVVPIMKKNRSGLIINLLTSAIVDSPPPRMSSYVTAKYGILGLTKSLAVELAPFHVKVVGISPTFVETELINAFPAKLLEIESEKQPDQCLLQPEDIAKVAWHIVQENHKYPSGGNITIKSRKDVMKLTGGNWVNVLESGHRKHMKDEECSK